jgi:hypothetical protein
MYASNQIITCHFVNRFYKKIMNDKYKCNSKNLRDQYELRYLISQHWSFTWMCVINLLVKINL